MHSHHTVPQARGGENSQQIILCSSCHNILHANALFIISRMRNPKRPAKTFWSTEREASRAEKWLRILVTALLTPVDNADAVEHPVGTKLKGADFQLFKILASNLGCSQEKAVEFCIKYTMQAKGIKNETKPKLWFMSLPKP